MAAFVISSALGEIKNIVPYLEFCNLLMDRVVSSKFLASSSLSHQNYAQSLSEEQILSYTPAAAAIINNPIKTKPLIIDAIQSAKVHPLLRLRAATFLMKIEPESLNENILLNISKDEPVMAELLECVKNKRVISWDFVDYHVCREPTAENLAHYKFLEDRYQEYINK